MRLIDADALMQNAEYKGKHDILTAHDVVAAPTVDAVPVVRCGECRWWDQKEGSLYGYCYACRHNFFSPNWEISILRTYREDFFCADGERKGGEADE